MKTDRSIILSDFAKFFGLFIKIVANMLVPWRDYRQGRKFILFFWKRSV
jgi:hypothetical protein